jgi:Tol biopolymer transport system component
MRVLTGVVAVALVSALSAGAARTTPATGLVSVSWDGSWGDRDSWGGALSADGRYMAFASDARNIVRSQPAGIFIRDLRRKTTVRVSPVGGAPLLTPDARFVLFCTPFALVRQDFYEPGDDYGAYNDIYVSNRRTGRVVRASMPAFGARRRTRVLPACAGTGDFRNLSEPQISSNGRYVAFGSKAGYIVRGDTNRVEDVFVRDLVLDRTRRISVTPSGGQANGISWEPHIVGNRFVYFCSSARNLLRGALWNNGVFVHDLAKRTTRRIRLHGYRAAMVEGACPQAFAADAHVFAAVTRALRGRPRRVVHLVVGRLGSSRYDVITRAIGIGPLGVPYLVDSPSLSSDGRYVAFRSDSPNLVPGDTNQRRDVFWFDRVRRRMVRVSLAAAGGEIEDLLGSSLTSISSDGRWVAWQTRDQNVVLTEPPGHNTEDVFIRGPMH